MTTTSCSPLTALEPSCRPPTSSATASRSTATHTTRRWQGCRASCRRTGAAGHQEATDVTWVATNDWLAATLGWSSFLETAGCAGCQQAAVADGTEARLPGGTADTPAGPSFILGCRQALSTVGLSGPTLFAPIINQAMQVCGGTNCFVPITPSTERGGLEVKQAGSLPLTSDNVPMCRLRVSPPPLPSIGCCSS